MPVALGALLGRAAPSVSIRGDGAVDHAGDEGGRRLHRHAVVLSAHEIHLLLGVCVLGRLLLGAARLLARGDGRQGAEAKERARNVVLG